MNATYFQDAVFLCCALRQSCYIAGHRERVGTYAWRASGVYHYFKETQLFYDQKVSVCYLKFYTWAKRDSCFSGFLP